MIKLTSILKEITSSNLQTVLDKIKNKQYRLYGQGDNGRVYEIDGEDKVFKITKEQDEYKVASIIVDKYDQFTTFIPVYYVDGKNMYVMSKASPLPDNIIKLFNQFIEEFKFFARSEGGEVSIFDFINSDSSPELRPQLSNFLSALQQDIEKLNIVDFDLDLDFRSDNIMIWNGNMVMIDW